MKTHPSRSQRHRRRKQRSSVTQSTRIGECDLCALGAGDSELRIGDQAAERVVSAGRCATVKIGGDAADRPLRQRRRELQIVLDDGADFWIRRERRICSAQRVSGTNAIWNRNIARAVRSRTIFPVARSISRSITETSLPYEAA